MKLRRVGKGEIALASAMIDRELQAVLGVELASVAIREAGLKEHLRQLIS